MKQTLLLLIFVLMSFIGFSQVASRQTNGADGFGWSSQKPTINVYPNPATDFISLTNDNSSVQRVMVYNLIGRLTKTFEVEYEEQRFTVSDLPDGLYLVRLMDKTGKIVVTQRINKR
jgi:Secretion system C-terminal sorting domain